jgi:hypothetical protein
MAQPSALAGLAHARTLRPPFLYRPHSLPCRSRVPLTHRRRHASRIRRRRPCRHRHRRRPPVAQDLPAAGQAEDPLVHRRPLDRQPDNWRRHLRVVGQRAAKHPQSGHRADLLGHWRPADPVRRLRMARIRPVDAGEARRRRRHPVRAAQRRRKELRGLLRSL